MLQQYVSAELIRYVCVVNFKVEGSGLFVKHKKAVIFCHTLLQEGGQKCTSVKVGRMSTGKGNVGAIICRKA